MATKPKLDVDLSGKLIDQTDYRSKIGSLMYLTSSRPDIVQAVCYCARRYQARQTEKYLKRGYEIFRYLRGTINMGLWYSKDSGFELTAFSDADHAGCIDTRKSTSGGIYNSGDKLVSWMSKKQDCTAMSSAEAEYKRQCCCLIPAESDSLPHAHTKTTKTYYKHQDLRIKKAQELKTKTFAYSDIKDNSSKTMLRGRLLKSSQEDAKYEHVGQDTRLQGGKNNQD
ncbi:hypothetical protein Tco_0565836 [Tanacetum coccineum]